MRSSVMGGILRIAIVLALSTAYSCSPAPLPLKSEVAASEEEPTATVTALDWRGEATVGKWLSPTFSFGEGVVRVWVSPAIIVGIHGWNECTDFPLRLFETCWEQFPVGLGKRWKLHCWNDQPCQHPMVITIHVVAIVFDDIPKRQSGRRKQAGVIDNFAK